MADMTRIVTAVIAITVRDYKLRFVNDECYRFGFSSCAHDRRVHRRIRCTCRLCSDPWRRDAHGNCRYSDGCC